MKPLQITCNKIRQKIIPFWYLFRISTVVMGLRLVGFVSAAALALLGVLSLDTSWTTATEWWSEGEVNVFLGVKSDNVWWDIDNLKKYFTKCPISYCRSKYRFFCLWNESSLYLHTEINLHSTSRLHLHSSEIVWISTNQNGVYSGDYFG